MTQSLVQEISKHTSDGVTLELKVDALADFTMADDAVDVARAPLLDVEDTSIEQLNGREGLLTRLVQVSNLSVINIRDVCLSHDDSMMLANLLAATPCAVRELRAFECQFLDHGGTLIADAFSSNQSLKKLLLFNIFSDDVFCNALISSLATNSSIEELDVTSNEVSFPASVPDLFKSIARQNQTLKTFI